MRAHSHYYARDNWGITWYCCIHHFANHAHSAMAGIYGNSSPIGYLLVVKCNKVRSTEQCWFNM